MTEQVVREQADEVWRVALRPPLLTVRFREAQRIASWAIVGGGLRTGFTVAWLGVNNADLPPALDPAAFLGERLLRADLQDAVGLLTSRDLGAYVVHEARHGHVSVPLADTASLEALALAAEARALAVLEARTPSSASGRPATGTGTDCIVVASPSVAGDHAQRYAGKHTAVGHVIGAAVHGAVRRGAAAWLAEQAPREAAR